MFSKQVEDLLRQLSQNGATAFVVGGAVRDAVRGNNNPKDLDIEIYGISLQNLIQLAFTIGPVKQVGKSFGVITLAHPTLGPVDITLPRKDNKTGEGYKEFKIEIDPNLSFKEGTSRRDFTFNSLMYSPITGLLDHFKGVRDLENGILRAVSDKFSEDPLRVLRAMQFAARMDLVMNPQTALMSRSLYEEYNALSKDRVWGEWWKWATKSIKPSKGLNILVESGWINHYPQIQQMMGTPQDPKWHPEGDVFIHTSLVCDAAAQIAIDRNLSAQDRCVLVMAALCHDMAKPATTELIGGSWKTRGHEKAGEGPTLDFLDSIGAPNWVKEKVAPLVVNHLAYASGDPTPKMVRRLANRLGNKVSIGDLSLLVLADHSGRPPLPQVMPSRMQQILDIAASEKVEQGQPQALLMGKDLISLGLNPGPQFGVLLNAAFQAQLDGVFLNKEDAISWVKDQLR